MVGSVEITRRIAAVLGPTLVAVTVSETINLDIWSHVDATVVYLNGLLFLVGGLVIVTNHNRWHFGGPLLVTLSGWLLLTAGMYRMFFPVAPQLDPGPFTYGFIALLGLLGAALCLIAFAKR